MSELAWFGPADSSIIIKKNILAPVIHMRCVEGFVEAQGISAGRNWFQRPLVTHSRCQGFLNQVPGTWFWFR